MDTGSIVSIILILGALVLALRGLNWRAQSGKRIAALALVWIAIIVGVVLVLRLSGVR